jgi:hypothetical protein
MSRGGYTPVGPVTYNSDFWIWGQIPDGYTVRIEVRDLRSERDHGYVWMGGHHKVVVSGPQPRPRTKTFIGESAWSNAERYAGDVVSDLQRKERGERMWLVKEAS